MKFAITSSCKSFVISQVLFLVVITFLSLLSCKTSEVEEYSATLEKIEITNREKQKEHLELLLDWLPPDRYNNTDRGTVSFFDNTFQDWLERTGELPPDFDNMPSIPFLPDPLVLDEGRRNIPVQTSEQWAEKRKWMKKNLEYYITGTYPPAPDNIEVNILSEELDGDVLLRMVELRFGPENRARLTLEVMIPPGDGPFPVFLSQWNHREWAQVAVRRGYIGCIYAGADVRDDTEEYAEIWAGEYDFTRLMRRAYGASRAVDYLYMLPEVDKSSIGITGHSRNGKLSLIAAAFDKRITACIPSSGCSGSAIPWRYTSDNYDVEDISLLSVARPSWLHPRLRFFVGHEHKLPVDQNHFIALIAPRGLLLSKALTEGANNPWAVEQVYHASKKVYEFLGAPQNIAVRSRYGLHSISAKDMEDYIDFFDFVFGRSNIAPENRLYYPYTFDSWLATSGEKTDPSDFPAKSIDDLLHDSSNGRIGSLADWNKKRDEIKDNVRWILGEEPPGVTNYGPRSYRRGGRGERSFGTFLTRPLSVPGTGVTAVSPYSGFGDQLFGYLYYPVDSGGDVSGDNLPVFIYLHEYDYSKGINSYHQAESFIRSVTEQGYAVFVYDMIGFGNRIEEGTLFYDRYPNWSKMGKMVVDAKGAVDAMVNMDIIDSTKVFIGGYSLGATVGLFTAALDERIAGLISVAGFTPMRTNNLARGTEGIKAYSHLHGLIPRLGFFVDHEKRIPADFDEMLAAIAPRPALIIAPVYDKDAHLNDIELCIDRVSQVYSLYHEDTNLEFFSPKEYNRFSDIMREEVYRWLEDQL